MVIFTCSPISAQWDLTITDKSCIPLGVVYISGSTPNVVTDLIILLLPVPYVWKLQARIAQRLLLAGMFMLGCFVSVVSVVRLAILVDIPMESSDVTYNTKEVIVWSIVEINIGLVCACLPSMKQALRLLRLDGLILVSAGRTQPTLDPNTFPLTVGATSGERSRGHRRGISGILLSSLAGPTKLDDDEDSYQMIYKTHAARGRNEISVESVRRPGDMSDTDAESHDARGLSRDGQGINIQRNWSVLVDEKSKRGSWAEQLRRT